MPSDTRPLRTSPTDKPLRMRSASRSTQQRVAKVARDSASTDHTELIVRDSLFFVVFSFELSADGGGGDAEAAHAAKIDQKTNACDQW